MSTSAANVLQDAVDGDEIVQGRSLWVDAWRRLRRNRAAVTSLVILTVMLLICFAGPLLAPYSFDAVDWDKVATAPSLSDGHFFGTDSVGRDLFVRTLVGGQISLLVGIVATAVSLLIGTAWGATAGYLGGRVDAVMMRVVDILYALPFMFLVILLMVLFGRNIVLIFVAIGAITWLDRSRHSGASAKLTIGLPRLRMHLFFRHCRSSMSRPPSRDPARRKPPAPTTSVPRRGRRAASPLPS